MVTARRLIQGVLSGDRIAVSKAITEIENDGPNSREIMHEIYPRTGRAFVIGITGPPGTGKSTLVDKLISAYRTSGKKVAVLAIDPTSPISGGAMLGDRVRMLGHALDSDVYIRSMASRGEAGGLARAARGAIRILDAAGNNIIIVETVGIGQAEVDIVRVADVVVVVIMPELGDEIQAFKAGLFEIGDVFVVNKSDLPGVDRAIYNLSALLTARAPRTAKALRTSATTGAGIPELVKELDGFLAESKDSASSEKKRTRNISEEILDSVSSEASKRLTKTLRHDPKFASLVDKVVTRELDPESASDMLLRRLTRRKLVL